MIGLEWRGVIDEYRRGYEYLADDAPIGSEFSISFSFDTAAENLCGSSSGPRYSGLYAMAQPATMSFMGNTYQSTGFIEVDAPHGTCLSPSPSTGVDFRFTSWQLVEVTNPDLVDFPPLFLSAISGYYGDIPGAIPGAPPPAGHPSAFFSTPFRGEGTLSSTAVVPEPATFFLLGSGLIAAWGVRRSRSR